MKELILYDGENRIVEHLLYPYGSRIEKSEKIKENVISEAPLTVVLNGSSATDLAKDIHLDRSTISRYLNFLKKKGLMFGPITYNLHRSKGERKSLDIKAPARKNVRIYFLRMHHLSNLIVNSFCKKYPRIIKTSHEAEVLAKFIRIFGYDFFREWETKEKALLNYLAEYYKGSKVEFCVDESLVEYAENEGIIPKYFNITKELSKSEFGEHAKKYKQVKIEKEDIIKILKGIYKRGIVYMSRAPSNVENQIKWAETYGDNIPEGDYDTLNSIMTRAWLNKIILEDPALIPCRMALWEKIDPGYSIPTSELEKQIEKFISSGEAFRLASSRKEIGYVTRKTLEGIEQKEYKEVEIKKFKYGEK